MGTVRVIGLDVAKNVFQVHGVDAEGAVVLRQRIARARMLKLFGKLPLCLVGIEACATSHYWARQLVAVGHEVKLMPAQYVKPFVKRSKNDAADAEAICEAVTRPTMRFVGIKNPEQQSAMMLHRVRLILSRQRTQLTNALRAHMAEFGIVVAIGRGGIDRLLEVIADTEDKRIPAEVRACLDMLVAQLTIVKAQILDSDRQILASARATELGRRLMETRARPKVDRIACPWLIRRFVDPSAVFLFVPPAEVQGVAERFGATAFDVEGPGMVWSHRGDQCTFDVMVEVFGLATLPALARLAPIVRGADTARPELAPEAAGPVALSLGLSRMFADDLEQLEAGMLIYDALYRWCRDAADETHDCTAHTPPKPGPRR